MRHHRGEEVLRAAQLRTELVRQLGGALIIARRRDVVQLRVARLAQLPLVQGGQTWSRLPATVSGGCSAGQRQRTLSPSPQKKMTDACGAVRPDGVLGRSALRRPSCERVEQPRTQQRESSSLSAPATRECSLK